MRNEDRRSYPLESDPGSSGIYSHTESDRLQPLIPFVPVIGRIVELLSVVLPRNAAFDEFVRRIDQSEDIVEQRVGYRSARIEDQVVLHGFVTAAGLQIRESDVFSVELRIITTVYVEAVVLISQPSNFCT